MSEIDFRHEPENHRFVASVGGDTARVVYAEAGGDTMDYTSTWVPPDLRGEGIGEEIVVRALDWAREHDKRVVPSCPFVTKVIDDHPEYRDLVADRDG